MILSNYIVSWVVTYLGDLQPTYIGLIIYLLSTMDIPVGLNIAVSMFDVWIFSHRNQPSYSQMMTFRCPITSELRSILVP